MHSIGLHRKEVCVVEYDPEWSRAYEKEKSALLEDISSIILGIEHIGSTSVPGLCAKPLIDMVVGVSDLADAELLQEALEKRGYEYRGGQGREDRILYAKGPREKRTHMLHVVVHNMEEWNRLIAFRDHLRNNPEVAQHYEKLKRELAEKYPKNRDMYTSGKNDFIHQVLNTIL
jgi:GrpB-like predicted nucleotidyltransferase (UPF0157 family)